jgi:phosphoribosylpyrophosphate synthetase
VTHGILSGSAIETINKSLLTTVVVTNTVPLGDKVNQCDKLRIIDVSPTIAEVRFHPPRLTRSRPPSFHDVVMC